MRSKTKAYFILAFLFVLIIAAIFQSHYYRTNQKIYSRLLESYTLLSDPSFDKDGVSLIGKQFVDFTLEDTEGDIWDLSIAKSKIKVLIYFSTMDCATCLQEYRLWNKIFAAYSREQVIVLGISHHDELSEVNLFKSAKEIRFPILIDRQNVLRKNIGIRVSPLRITLDDKNKIIDISRPDAEMKKQKEFLKFLEYRLRQEGGP